MHDLLNYFAWDVIDIPGTRIKCVTSNVLMVECFHAANDCREPVIKTPRKQLYSFANGDECDVKTYFSKNISVTFLKLVR